MDGEDEPQSYLKFLNDGHHNFLLQSTEEEITDGFPVESIFTEIPQDWQSDGYPILLSGSLVTEDNNEQGATNGIELFTSENSADAVNEDSEGDTITYFQNVEMPDEDTPSNNLILSNDVLMQLNGEDECDNDSQEESDQNIITYSITYTPADNNTDVVNSTGEASLDDIPNGITIKNNASDLDTIQLLNTDGTITTINKNLLSLIQAQEDSTESQQSIRIEDYFEEIAAAKCKLCGFICESREDIKTHIRIKHHGEISENNGAALALPNGASDNCVGKKMNSILNTKKYTMYVCSECGNGYSMKEDLKQHMIAQHNLVYIREVNAEKKDDSANERKAEREKEAKSNKRLNSESLLKRQLKSMKKIKCSIKGCPLKFAKDDLRKRHEDCHVNREKKQFMCPVCKTKFSIWRICSMHMWKCHSIDLGLLSCPMCHQFKSLSTARVLNHMSIHKEEKPFVCSACGKDFKQMNQLRNHEILHKAPDEVPDWFASKQCEFCDRHFASAKSLKKHIKFVHDKFKPFICSICGHQTARKEMLQLHYRQHTGHKPHQCAYCDYKTGDHNCLRKHTMRHFGTAKYSCPYCSYQAIQASAYKSHMASKHPGKEGTYSCTICAYTTVNVTSYLSHVKCHELEKRKQNNTTTEQNVGDDHENTLNCEGNGNPKLIAVSGVLSNGGEDDETQHCFLNAEPLEETVDTGGITIPAGLDLQLVT